MLNRLLQEGFSRACKPVSTVRLMVGALLPIIKASMQAEVTGGGVPLSEVNCATLESRVAPGLFLCGEILDVFGRIGGFNFYWAWLSGRLAGLGAGGVKNANK